MDKVRKKPGVGRRRGLEIAASIVVDEIYSMQTDTVSCALVEAYKHQNLVHEDIIIAEQLISQGRYWHGS